MTGGLDLGLERAGWECRWQVENDPYCLAVLAQHWPDVPRYGDVREIDGRELEHVDLLAGGFPCQPVSSAGLQRGTDDPRWLWPEFARLVRVLRPRLVLVENVPGLLIRGFGDVVGDLAAGGYDAEWDCLPAAAFGAPHLRDRLFIVAYPTGAGLEGLQHAQLVFAERPPSAVRGQWAAEPAVARVAARTPARVERTTALGNAVVPQVAEWLGHQLRRALDPWPRAKEF